MSSRTKCLDVDSVQGVSNSQSGSLLIHLRNLLSDLVEALSSRGNETKIWPRWRQDSREVFWVVLDTNEPRMVLDLHNLHTLTLVILANEVQSTLSQTINVLWVDLVSVAVSLEDLGLVAVQGAELGPLRSRLELSWAETKTHGATHSGLVNLWHEHDDWIFSALVQLRRGRALHVAHMARKLNNSDLHTEADTKVWGFVGTCPLRSLDHTLGTAVSETTWNQDSIGGADLVPRLVVSGWVALLGCVLQLGGVDPAEVELLLAAHSGVLERLDDGKVGVVEGGVLADQSDVDFLGGVVDAVGQLGPLMPCALAAVDEVLGLWNSVELEDLGEGGDETLVLEEDWDVVGRLDVVDSDDLLRLNLTEHGNLVGGGLLEWDVASAGNQIWTQTSGSGVLDSSLGWLSLLLTLDDWDQRNVDLEEVVLSGSASQLSHGLNEWRRLDISYSSSELDNADVWGLVGVVNWDLGDALNPVLNGVG